ncbi:MAG: hypothetical protein ACE5GW_05175 [Planctomycetota bacterium]
MKLLGLFSASLALFGVGLDLAREGWRQTRSREKNLLLEERIALRREQIEEAHLALQSLLFSTSVGSAAPFESAPALTTSMDREGPPWSLRGTEAPALAGPVFLLRAGHDRPLALGEWLKRREQDGF